MVLDLAHEACHFSLNPHFVFKFQPEVDESSVISTSRNKTVFSGFVQEFPDLFPENPEHWQDEGVTWLRQITCQWGQRRDLLLLAVMCYGRGLLNIVPITPARLSLFRKEAQFSSLGTRRLHTSKRECDPWFLSVTRPGEHIRLFLEGGGF